MSIRRAMLVGGIAMLSAHDAAPTSIRSVSLADLYREATVVALLRVTGAEGVAFKSPVYRAEILHGYKGVVKGEVVYFGPYETYALGQEYFAFLTRPEEALSSIQLGPSSPWPDAAQKPYLRVMYGGYSILPVQYTCIIPGCDDGVSVAISQILLPATVGVVRRECDPGSQRDTWVRKKDFAALLVGLSSGGTK